MQIKDRKVFSLNNFRGLDKENKPLKVASFRATEGKNFIIDSQTLKTRPAVKLNKPFAPFDLDENDYIIDFYNFSGVTIYVTKNHFWFYDTTREVLNTGNIYKNPFNETHNIQNSVGENVLIKGVLPAINNEDKTPFFIEEKECLFIFCLGHIFVFSKIENGVNPYYVFYELKDKPESNVTTNLPDIYIPTLFVGGNSFDDVNLLSKKHKYKIFSDSVDPKNGRKTFYLPTHYSQEKNGSFSSTIKMYNGVFDDINLFPIFIGITGEHTVAEDETEIQVLYGLLHEENSEVYEVAVNEKYIAHKNAEYKSDPIDPATPTMVVSEVVGITNKEFFDMSVNYNGTTMSVFDFLIYRIRNNHNDSPTNITYRFSLDVIFDSIFKNETTDALLLSKKRTVNKKVYVQIHPYSNTVVDISKTKTVDDNYIKVLSSETWVDNPIIPIVDLTGYEQILDNVYQNPILIGNYDTFLKETYLTVSGYINDNLESLPDGKKMYLVTKTYIPEQVNEVASKTLNPTAEWFKKSYYPYRIASTPYTPDFDDFPLTDLTYDYAYSQIIKFNTTYVNFNDNTYFAIIQNAINSMILPDGTFDIVLRYYLEYEADFQYISERYAIVVTVQVVNAGLKNYEHRRSTIIKFTLDKNLVVDERQKIEYKPIDNVLELTIQDYYFDYENEPAIEVQIDFEKNPDYNIISKCKFGTVFGSENRLFLAGNPTYPNIDRYNVSNDLLGNNVISQSYELTYFPSKNYRVVGGKGAINGYVVATDSQLYITKENYPSDSNLFIRTRNIDESGIVSYFESKTSINKTPIDHKNIIRYFNDILMLTKDGLFAMEISNNILTNERMLKLRSGFINKDLIATVSRYGAFLTEDQNYLYIFSGNFVYVIDARYTAENENSIIENISYEIVKWELENKHKVAKLIGDEFILLEEQGKYFYSLIPDSYDDTFTRYENGLISRYVSGSPSRYYLELVDDTLLEKLMVYGNKILITNKVYDMIYRFGEHYDINGFTAEQIARLSSYDSIYVRRYDNLLGRYVYKKATMTNVRVNPSYPLQYLFDLSYEDDGYNYSVTSDIFILVQNKPLYVTNIFEKTIGTPKTVIRLSLVPDVILEEEDYSNNEDIIYGTEESSAVYLNFILIEPLNLELYWQSAITDFGNNLFEKTSFKTYIYATKQAKANTLVFGYRTMRRLKALDEGESLALSKTLDLSNTFDFGEVNFNTFALSTFGEVGMSLPMKENNFLYIQFMIRGNGQIEINSIEVTYKLNRLIKSIG